MDSRIDERGGSMEVDRYSDEWWAHLDKHARRSYLVGQILFLGGVGFSIYVAVHHLPIAWAFLAFAPSVSIFLFEQYAEGNAI